MNKLTTIISILFLLCATASVKSQNTLTFTESYTTGVNPTVGQQTHWTNFKASLTSNYCYTKVHLYGSNNATGITITNPPDVATIASNIRQGITFQLASGGHNWQYCSNDLRIDGQAVNYCSSCDAGNCLRPTSAFGGNWGGLNGNTCGAGSQTITLEFTYSVPTVSLGNDTLVCGTSLLLDAGNAGATYIWQDASTDQTLTAMSDGKYYVDVTNSCGTSSDTIHVTFSQAPAQPGAVSGSASVCEASSNTYSISAVPEATSYSWTLPSGWSGSSSTESIDATAGTSGGTISVTANNSCGSSAAQTLSATINSVDTSITTDGLILTSNATSAAYQWVTCPDMAPIFGETNPSFTPSANGDYAVIVNQNDCNDTSSCYQVTTVGLKGFSAPSDFIVYPNPASQNAVLQFDNAGNRSYTLTIFNSYGQLVQTISDVITGSILIETKNFAPGIYTLHLQFANKIITGKLVVGK